MRVQGRCRERARVQTSPGDWGFFSDLHLALFLRYRSFVQYNFLRACIRMSVLYSWKKIRRSLHFSQWFCHREGEFLGGGKLFRSQLFQVNWLGVKWKESYRRSIGI